MTRQFVLIRAGQGRGGIRAVRIGHKEVTFAESDPARPLDSTE